MVDSKAARDELRSILADILAKTVRTPESEEKAHAVYSASGSERWLNCPGSIDLAKSAPPERESKYAVEGTMAHACLEFFMLTLSTAHTHPDVVSVARECEEFNEEMIDHAIDAVAWIDDYWSEHDGATLLSETRVDAELFTKEGQFGTVDVAIVQLFGRLVVVDYKYGAGHAVDPDGDGLGNSQLVYYALGLAYKYDLNFSEVELVVIQPRAYHPSGERIRRFKMSMDELLVWGERFKEGVAATLEPDAPLVPGPWCKFCRAGAICSALKGQAVEKTGSVWDEIDGLLSVPEPSMITVPHLGTVLDGCDAMELWIEKVRAHAAAVMQRGHRVKGWKMVEKAGRRKWAMEADLAEDAALLFGDEAFSKPKLLSPAQLEKRLPQTKTWVEQNTVRGGGLTMVKESDRRSGVQPLDEVFKNDQPVVELEVLSVRATSKTKRRTK